ncbi:hypothetical protein DCMF_09355 [Candidatus Formimonas warabiya]|uniref:Uncharacterized protein n=1 Tax=Formimonas warabiya TaxID=1761012 RepID=A0A3G1KR68_FORW1|nr:hypothetical protein DCMF_09355 [Candidatus Formimonas warabiya]
MVTHQRITKNGFQSIGPAASRLAQPEGLYAHKLAAECGTENEITFKIEKTGKKRVPSYALFL